MNRNAVAEINLELIDLNDYISVQSSQRAKTFILFYFIYLF